MSEKSKNLDASKSLEPLTLENLDAFLARAKAQNPIMFAIDEARGDFEKLRIELGGKPKEVKKVK